MGKSESIPIHHVSTIEWVASTFSTTTAMHLETDKWRSSCGEVLTNQRTKAYDYGQDKVSRGCDDP